MSMLPHKVDALLADPYSDARAAARAGQRVIGYVGPDAPVELILSSGALPLRLSGALDVHASHADRFIERAFMPEIRSIAGQWLAGALDFLSAVVLPRSDDSAQRLYYYICELQRTAKCAGPVPLIHDVASIGRQVSFEHTIAATTRLAVSIGMRANALPEAADRTSARATLLRRLMSASIAGSTVNRVARALQYSWQPSLEREIQSWLDDGPTPSPAECRVMLVGNSPPDDRLHVALESANATVVRELTDAKWFPLPGETAAPRADYIEAIGARYHSRLTLAQSLAQLPEILSSEARAVQADGVVIWAIEEDETLPWVLPAQLRALQGAGVPTLALTRQQWKPAPETLRAVSEFALNLKVER
jgi:hypothetical protein